MLHVWKRKDGVCGVCGGVCGCGGGGVVVMVVVVVGWWWWRLVVHDEIFRQILPK